MDLSTLGKERDGETPLRMRMSVGFTLVLTALIRICAEWLIGCSKHSDIISEHYNIMFNVHVLSFVSQ